jgi:hypothetical protein
MGHSYASERPWGGAEPACAAYQAREIAMFHVKPAHLLVARAGCSRRPRAIHDEPGYEVEAMATKPTVRFT